MRQVKTLALIYVFATSSVAPKVRRLCRRGKCGSAKAFKRVLTPTQFHDFIDLGRGPSDDEDGAITAWSMALERKQRENFLEVLKTEYRGTPHTRRLARRLASTCSRRVQQAFREYNFLLDSAIRMPDILEAVQALQARPDFFDDLERDYFDTLIDLQMHFSIDQYY